MSDSSLAEHAWTVLESKYAVNDPWMKLKSDKVQLPDGRILAPYYTIEYPDWVEVIALTVDLKIVLCEQYRHGAQRLTLDLPGGAIAGSDPPQATIERELREETGYVSHNWRLLGSHYADAARQSNRIHAFLALDSHKETEQMLDDGEAIQPRELLWDDFTRRLASGELMFSAGQMASLLWLQILAANATEQAIRRLCWASSAPHAGSGSLVP